jgi:hypothetical protein
MCQVTKCIRELEPKGKVWSEDLNLRKEESPDLNLEMPLT